MFANKAGIQNPNLQYLWLDVVSMHLSPCVATTTCPEHHSARLPVKRNWNCPLGVGQCPSLCHLFWGGFNVLLVTKWGTYAPLEIKDTKGCEDSLCASALDQIDPMLPHFNYNMAPATPLQLHYGTTCCSTGTWGPIDFNWFNAGEVWIHDEGSISHLQHQNHGDFNSLLFQQYYT